MGSYTLVCLECGLKMEDRLQNWCPLGHDALLRSEYRERKLKVKNFPGMWKFLEWLPCTSPLPTEGEALTYKSEGLARELGLKDLYISFSGYWPERGAKLMSCSFKELEASSVLARTKERSRGIMVVASAGNTARAFALLSEKTSVQVMAVVPRPYLSRIWVPGEKPSHFLLLGAEGGYREAIQWVERISRLEGTIAEGGARNVGRRDGIGTLLLSAVLEMGRLPDHYFQAVGSGVGALAVLEASLRLLADGGFGKRLPRLHLSQNLPFAPMFHAWKEGRNRILPELDLPSPEEAEKEMYATILSNPSPPYSVKGGVYEALRMSGGRMYGISNKEALEAWKWVREEEGIDLDPAASVAVASLVRAVEEGEVKEEEMVLLNLSGGGYERIREDFSLSPIEPSLILNKDTSLEEVKEVMKGWCSLAR
ncbi:MAG: cysteate synthase [Candidatus Hadarchaeales archaeon]